MSEVKDSGVVFASMTGDYPNIGDAVIRRLALQWVPSGAELNTYVGRSPQPWAEQIGANGRGEVFRGRDGAVRWLARLVASRKPVLIYEPGEVALPLKAAIRETFFLFLNILVRLKGGKIVYTPRSIVRPHRIAMLVYRIQVSLSAHAFWREPVTSAMRLRGLSSPDIAFSLKDSEHRPEHDASSELRVEERDLLIVSLRGKRKFPSDDWFEAVRTVAVDRNLTLFAVTQVAEDATRTAEIADRLGCDHLGWSEDLLELERHLVDFYRRAQLVVSDRLHVLAIAGIYGAPIVEIVESPSSKVANHFRQIGVVDISLNAVGRSSDEISKFMINRIDAMEDQASAFNAAQDKATGLFSLAFERRFGGKE